MANIEPASPTNAGGPLDEFWKMLRELERFWAWIVAAAALPFLASLAQITPPWPPGITIITTAATLITLVLCYQTVRGKSRRNATKLLKKLSICLGIVALIYVFAISEYVVRGPDDIALVKGFICTGIAEQTFAELCPFLGAEQLKTAQWDPELLWTGSSISVVRTLLVAAWVATFVLLSAVLAAFIVHRMAPAKPNPG